MPVFRQPQEDELHRAAASALTSADASGFPCPSREEWGRIVSGAYAKNTEASQRALDHLATCHNCETVLRELRALRVRRQRMQRIALVASFAAACILVALAVSAWFNHRHVATVAVLDLRDASPTRGTEVATAPAVGTIAREVDSMRILLPVGSGPGFYHIGIFQAGEPPRQVLATTGNAVAAGSRVEMSVPFHRKELAPGRHLLGLRTENAGWDFYPINIQ